MSTKQMSTTIKFRGKTLIVTKETYDNDRIALSIEDQKGECYMIASVNMPDDDVPGPEYTFIKDYSENAGIYQCLINNKICSPEITPGHLLRMSIFLVKVLI